MTGELHSQGLTRADCEEKVVCIKCRGTRWIYLPDKRAVRRCDCQIEKIKEEKLRDITDNWSVYGNARLNDMVPRDPKQKKALDIVKRDPLASYLFTGYYSTGKTHFLIAQYRYLLLNDFKSILRSSRDLISELRQAEITKEDGSSYTSQFINALHGSDRCHFFIDDIEKAPAKSDFRMEMLFDVLDIIRRRDLGLTVTSNLGISDLPGYIGEAATVRLHKICRVVDL